jgi:iron complex transport system permease protein
VKRPRPILTARRLALCCLGFLALLLTALVVGVSFGSGGVSPADLWAGGLGEQHRAILLQIRIPRVLMAALLGGALSIAGVGFQALLRNPLADPYVLGVSGGASIGGVIALTLIKLPQPLIVPLFAFAGALGALILIERIATVGGRMSVFTVLLTGAIFNAFSAAVIYFIQSLASLEELHSIVFHLMGRVREMELAWVGGFALVVLIPAILLTTQARAFNALATGEEGATQLGVDIERLKRRTFVLGALLTGVAVAMAGLIGFVGLVVPHLLRLWFGPDHRLLLPVSFLGGAAFLVLADTLARTITAPNELPVGVVTALVGGPFFLLLLRRRGATHGF